MTSLKYIISRVPLRPKILLSNRRPHFSALLNPGFLAKGRIYDRFSFLVTLPGKSFWSHRNGLYLTYFINDGNTSVYLLPSIFSYSLGVPAALLEGPQRRGILTSAHGQAAGPSPHWGCTHTCVLLADGNGQQHHISRRLRQWLVAGSTQPPAATSISCISIWQGCWCRRKKPFLPRSAEGALRMGVISRRFSLFLWVLSPFLLLNTSWGRLSMFPNHKGTLLRFCV